MANETVEEVKSSDSADEKADEKAVNNVEGKKKKETKVTKKQETEEEGSSDDEEQQGIYDKPLVITGKRERKSTEFLVQSTEVKKEARPLIFEGKGERLGSLERVNLELGKCSSLELKPLHKLLFGRDGRQAEIKKNIRNFNGFTFEKGSKEFESKQQAVERFTNEGLKRMCEILDLGKMGKREELMARVLEYLLSPVSSGKPLPQKKSSKKAKSSKKTAGKGAKRKRSAKSKNEADDEDEDNDDDEGEEDDEEDEEEEEEEPPKKKKAAASKAKAAKTDKKKPSRKKEPVPVKITPLKKGSAKKTPKKEKPVVLDDPSSDEEPLAKKAKKQPPTDEEIVTLVEGMLEEANLEEVTMKSICKQVFDHYPDFDLTKKKAFIKETVKKVIS